MVYKYKEHEVFQLTDTDNLQLDALYKSILEGTGRAEDIRKARLLGMDYDFRKKSYSMSYYIGTDWINQKEDLALMVVPKIQGIDFQKMFMYCFYNKNINENLDKLFVIHGECKPIKVSSKDFDIEPLLIIYFLSLVSAIVKTGLRKDYVIRDEDLTKIKGKLQISSYIKKSIIQKRKDRIPCRYQEYDIDCLDNRVLKAALLICKKMIERNRCSFGSHHSVLMSILGQCLACFEKVSSDITMRDLSAIHINPLFTHYKAALPIAKMIIKKQGYCVDHGESEEEQYFPPFVIDMPLLFERYVYGLLYERYGKQVGFQVKEDYNIMDFCLFRDHLIIDTKYKPKWDKKVDSDNVRQLSGYARNIPLRRRMGLDLHDESTICPCLIIYPAEDGVENFLELSDHLFEDNNLVNIDNYIKFKKMAVKLPINYNTINKN